MIDIIFVRFYLKENEVINCIQQLRRCFGQHIKKIIVINIGDKEFNFPYNMDGLDYIYFDSDMMDIAAYNKGLECLSDSESEMHFLLNDTLFTRHPSKYLLKRLTKSLWVKDITVPCALGVIDSTKSIHADSNSLISSVFISTFAFILNKSAVNLFRRTFLMANKVEIDSVFSAFLHLHVHHDGNPYSWKKNCHRDVKNIKKRCVHFERFFSRQLISSGGMLIDVNSSISNKIIYRFLDKLTR